MWVLRDGGRTGLADRTSRLTRACETFVYADRVTSSSPDPVSRAVPDVMGPRTWIAIGAARSSAAMEPTTTVTCPIEPWVTSRQAGTGLPSARPEAP